MQRQEAFISEQLSQGCLMAIKLEMRMRVLCSFIIHSFSSVHCTQEVLCSSSSETYLEAIYQSNNLPTEYCAFTNTCMTI